MPVLESHGVPIQYDVAGAGPAVLMIHGYTASSALWRAYGYAQALSKRYRMVTFDARGHGRSGKPHDPAAYAFDTRLDDVEAILDALDIDRAHIVAYSMGGWTAYGMAAYRPQRVASVAIGGAHPYAERLDALHAVDGSDGAAFIAALERSLGERIAPDIQAIMLRNDLRALVAAATDRGHIDPSRIVAPAMLYCGALDQRLTLVQRAAQELGCAPALVIPGADHTTALSHPAVLLPALERFLAAQAG